VLLDVEIEGVRCTLVRAPVVPRPRVTQGLLSPREQEIARMIGEGHSNKTIAAVLEISSWTVNTHLRRIFAKLGVTSRAAMVAKLMRGA
jgi:DNA-binding CsgD family transcriptional regulator